MCLPASAGAEPDTLFKKEIAMTHYLSAKESLVLLCAAIATHVGVFALVPFMLQ